MATKTSNIGIETAHYNNFKEYVPESDTFCPNTMAKLLNIGLLQVSTAFEYALANEGGHQVVSEDGRDISDGSDAKLATVRHRARETAYSAHVSSTKNKTGKLRVQVYEKKHNKFYYFVIPFDAHIKVKYLEIPFSLSGEPQRTNHWWNYEVPDFTRLSTD